MMEMIDGMLLYHGSYTTISNIDLSVCNAGLDFGKGFYLTSSYEQAYNYIPLSVKKARRMGRVDNDFPVEYGKISIFRFHYDPNLLIHYFPKANREWLHFVSANRNNKLFPLLLEKYRMTDIIVGKIADDQTARTLQQYIGEYFGIPGTMEADNDIIKRLLPNRLNAQFCFRTNDAIKCLEFIKGESYGNVKK